MKKTEEKKVTEEQLAKIKDQQLSMSNKLRDVGFLEQQNTCLLHEYAGLAQEMEEYKKELEKEYGAISVDLETGIYTEIDSSEIKQ
jgi:molecular chaperone GrpE (heat shock protein)